MIGEDTAAGDALCAEPSHSPGQDADRGGLLLVGQHLHVRQPRGVIDRHADLLVASATGTAPTAVAGDPVANSLEPSQLLGVHMEHVARLLPLVPLHRNLGVQVSQAAKAQRLHHPSHGRQGSPKGLGDPPEGAALVPEIHCVLQLLRIERSPLGAADTRSASEV